MLWSRWVYAHKPSMGDAPANPKHAGRCAVIDGACNPTVENKTTHVSVHQVCTLSNHATQRGGERGRRFFAAQASQAQ
eukprot:15460847-Alexandrium_andersonii.AAC.1